MNKISLPQAQKSYCPLGTKYDMSVKTHGHLHHRTDMLDNLRLCLSADKTGPSIVHRLPL